MITTNGTYNAAARAEGDAARRTAEALGLDALVCDAVCLAPTECPGGVDCRLYASHAAARASGETPLPPQTDPWVDSHGGPARTPSAPTLLETLVAAHGVEVAFKIWAMRRRPSPCRPQLWAAQSAHRAAVEAEKDAVADAKEARLARRVAAAATAEARAAVAVARAADMRSRI